MVGIQGAAMRSSSVSQGCGRGQEGGAVMLSAGVERSDPAQRNTTTSTCSTRGGQVTRALAWVQCSLRQTKDMQC